MTLFPERGPRAPACPAPVRTAMIRYAGRARARGDSVVVLVTMLTFVLLSRLPGDAAASRLGEAARIRRNAAYQEFVEELNLNQPLPLRYFNWLTSALRGDLGLSMRTDQPVWETIIGRFPVTLELGLLRWGWPSSSASRSASSRHESRTRSSTTPRPS